ncbi:MAG TPA: hypothetical protein VKF59_01060 [Candidatus Dormibacteraeota bacterium]|nr:hypothetical protein [Candidatus Dormibacteraeota bacterium]
MSDSTVSATRGAVPALLTVARDGVTWLVRLKIEGRAPLFFAVDGENEEQALDNAVIVIGTAARAMYEQPPHSGLLIE